MPVAASLRFGRVPGPKETKQRNYDYFRAFWRLLTPLFILQWNLHRQSKHKDASCVRRWESFGPSSSDQNVQVLWVQVQCAMLIWPENQETLGLVQVFPLTSYGALNKSQPFNACTWWFLSYLSSILLWWCWYACFAPSFLHPIIGLPWAYLLKS